MGHVQGSGYHLFALNLLIYACRCATECLVKHSDGPWRCDVYVYYVGEASENPRYIHFGETIFNPDEVTDRVRRAQQAILNPSQPDPLIYLGDTKTAADKNEISFSQDYISIQISGPDLVDLSFVDLPGESMYTFQAVS